MSLFYGRLFGHTDFEEREMTIILNNTITQCRGTKGGGIRAGRGEVWPPTLDSAGEATLFDEGTGGQGPPGGWPSSRPRFRRREKRRRDS